MTVSVCLAEPAGWEDVVCSPQPLAEHVAHLSCLAAAALVTPSSGCIHWAPQQAGPF